MDAMYGDGRPIELSTNSEALFNYYEYFCNSNSGSLRS